MTESLRTVPIDLVDIDPDVQPRVAGLDPAHVAALSEVLDDLPATTVVQKGERYVGVDGLHTFDAYRNAGRVEIVVHVIDLPEGTDLRSTAFELNLKHGKALSLEDKRAEASRQLRADPKTSDNTIAMHCALSQSTVAKVRADLEAGAQIEHVSTRTGRDGRTYPATPARTAAESEDERFAKLLVRLAKLLVELTATPQWDAPAKAASAIEAMFRDSDIDELRDFFQDTANQLAAILRALRFQA